MTRIHNLGFPRIGHQRELKKALESFWQGDINSTSLQETGKKLRQRHWLLQREAGLDLIPVGDFSWYDHVLDHSVMFGVIPERFGKPNGLVDLDSYFRMARGRGHCGHSTSACEMTKWFDTNYHYIVPEFDVDQHFVLSSNQLFDHVNEALELGLPVKPVLIGPLTYLWLGKTKGRHFDKLRLLPALTTIYQQILAKLTELGIEWVQIDEPILGLDLPKDWLTAFVSCYEKLQHGAPAILLTSYFSELQNNLEVACQLPVAGLHIDAVRAGNEIGKIVDLLPSTKILSLGVLDGRNIWRADLRARLAQAQSLKATLGDRLWLAPSCSLLHVPVDLDQEQHLDAELKSWLAFAVQKLNELALLKRGLQQGEASIAEALEQSDAAQFSRKNSLRIHNAEVKQRCAGLSALQIERRSPYPARIQQQRAWLKLPLFPTTTIGSFPQTESVRRYRRDFKQGRLSDEQYRQRINTEIAHAVKIQEQIGLDVLVHGEAERNDMVEYFGEQLQGFAFSDQGWVQSYGSRCVKPPILYGDVSRPKAMTLDWILYAQSLTNKPMKGMLTGPVTILNWSFVRDDQSRAQSCQQIALA
ncbi:MAG TPA: 5-methyltetrahydropteroyltriglutamate--homocysteine S-methyltransferase, partial [Pseudomonadales bacterium]|nr:5-methyltetrahydropteroyltriglutamate--homocysteine S-methyltransferase [Pseudomonadales bacterium]